MVWTAPDITLVDEQFTADEQTTLTEFLDAHRDYLLHKCAGLTGEQLIQQSVPPSNLSLLGIVRHMTEVERTWFRRRFAGDADLPRNYKRADNEDADIEEATAAGAEADYARYVAERKLCDEAIAGHSLEETFVHVKYGAMALRWTLQHMICEYAQHNGHADLLRECVDGRREAP